MNSKSFFDFKRRLINLFFKSALVSLTAIAVFAFAIIGWFVFQKGWPHFNLAFFTELPRPPGEAGGGILNAIVGSLIMVLLASLIGIPWGMAAGVYLSEYGKGRTAQVLRFTIDLMTTIPSIIIGIFVYGFIVVFFGFSTIAGACSLAIIMLPIVARSSEELLKLIPGHLREAGLGLGISRWKVILRLIVPSSRKGLLTGVMLAVARIFGETAPLLFTSLGNQFFSVSLTRPISAMPIQIYNFARSGFPEQEAMAWTGCLVLVLVVVMINLLTRILIHSRE